MDNQSAWKKAIMEYYEKQPLEAKLKLIVGVMAKRGMKIPDDARKYLQA